MGVENVPIKLDVAVGESIVLSLPAPSRALSERLRKSIRKSKSQGHGFHVWPGYGGGTGLCAGEENLSILFPRFMK